MKKSNQKHYFSLIYLIHIDSYSNPFVAEVYKSILVDLFDYVDLVRKQSMVLPKTRRERTCNGFELSIHHSWFSFIHKAWRFFNFNRVYGKYWRKLPDKKKRNQMMIIVLSFCYHWYSKLLNSIIDRFHRVIPLDNCLSSRKYSNTNNYRSNFKTTKILHFQLFSVLYPTVSGIAWIWLWSNVKNCSRCNKPILAGRFVRLLNDKCNSINEVKLNQSIKFQKKEKEKMIYSPILCGKRSIWLLFAVRILRFFKLTIVSGRCVRKLSDKWRSVIWQKPIEFGNWVNWFCERSRYVKFVNLSID